jgi:hypothetical protein
MLTAVAPIDAAGEVREKIKLSNSGYRWILGWSRPKDGQYLGWREI